MTCTMANHYYQQQPQYFKPQNIYDQLKNQDPQRVPAQLQHLLGQPQPTPSLVQQRIQSFQQPVQRPPTVYPQPGPLVPYHPGQLVPYHPYQPVYTPAPPHPQPPLVRSTPSAPQPTQRRPLPPDPAKRSRSEPQPLTPTRSQSPTRSRPLPPTTPAAPRIQSNAQPATNIQHPPSLRPRTPTRSQSPTRSRPLPPTTPTAPRIQTNIQPATDSQHPPSLRPRTPSPTKSNPPSQPPPTNVNANVHTEPPRRGRASPPRFSTVPISASSLSSHTTNSPSPGSSPSTSPTRQIAVRNPPPTASASGTRPFNAPSVTLPKSQPDPSPSPPKPKPVWKKTLPDVLPPLLPTPPPNPVRQQQPPRQQYNTSFNQPVPPPPVPSHSRPTQYKPTFVPRHPVTPATKVTLWNKSQPAPKPPQTTPKPSQSTPKPPQSEPKPPQFDENEDEEEEDGDNESEYTYEYYYSDEDEPIPKPLDPRMITPSPQASPQYGIRDLPPRTASNFPHPGPLPRPPPMVRGNGVFPPDSDSHVVQNPSNSSRPSNTKAGSRDMGDPRKGKSMTMRFAAGATSDKASSSSGPHREPPHTGILFGPDVWPENMPKLFQADGSEEISSRFDAINLDDTSPPRSVFSMRQNGADTPPSPQRRELPRPQSRALGNAAPNVGQQKQRPQSQIFSPGRVAEQENVIKESRRPQSQIYDEGFKHQRQQVFGRESREYPQQQDGYASHLNRRPQQSPTRQPESPRGQQQYNQVQSAMEYHRSSSPTRQQPQPGGSTRQQSLYQHHDQQSQRNQQQSRTPTRSPSPTIPQIPISIIESPAPIGGRAKLADIEKMESEGSASPTCSPSMPIITIMDDDEPSSTPRRGSGSAPQIHIDGLPSISVQGTSEDYGRRGSIPQINVSGVDRGGGGRQVREREQQQGRGPQINVFEVPGVSVSRPYDVPNGGDVRRPPHSQSRVAIGTSSSGVRRGGLVCGGCGGPIIGRIVNAMGQRWHPGCFKCTMCDELLEHVSSYESGGKAYCHLDYHEVCGGFHIA